MIAVFINIFSWIIKFWLDCDEDLEHNLLTKDSQASIFRCPKCGSCHTIKNGSKHNGKPKRKCKIPNAFYNTNEQIITSKLTTEVGEAAAIALLKDQYAVGTVTAKIVQPKPDG